MYLQEIPLENSPIAMTRQKSPVNGLGMPCVSEVAEIPPRKKPETKHLSLCRKLQFWRTTDTEEEKRLALDGLKQELTVDDHTLSQNQLLDKLQVDSREGLSDREAARRLATGNGNVLTPPRKTPEILKYAHEMITGFGPLLLGAAFSINCCVYHPVQYGTGSAG